MDNKDNRKIKKPIWKRWWLYIGAILVIIIIASIGGEEKKGPQEQNRASEEKFSFETYIAEDKIRKYEIVNKEDISTKALGKKNLSDYSTEEIEKLPLNFRMNYEIIIPSDITSEELKCTLAQLIKEKTEEDSDIDEIWVGAWENKESLEGGNPVVGRAEWCPNGDWAAITPEIAKNNIRDSYKIVYNIDEKALEAIKKTKEETISGLSESTRKEIFRELVECEDQADVESAKYYDPLCVTCPEFIESDVEKMAEVRSELEDTCKEKIRKKYNITEEMRIKIIAESFEKRWPMPQFIPFPNCCEY